MMAYLEGEEPSIPDLKKCIRKGTLSPPLLLSPLPLPSPFPLILGPSPSSSPPLSPSPYPYPLLSCAPSPGTLGGAFVPVLTGTAFKNKGVQPLLDAVIDYMHAAASQKTVPPAPGRAAQQLACPPRAYTDVGWARAC